MRKAEEVGVSANSGMPSGMADTTSIGNLALPAAAEIELLKLLVDFPSVVRAAGDNFSPALIAQYAYDIAKAYNGYYHDNSILREERENVRNMRIMLSAEVARTLLRGMGLLGIELPERM
jgi:arginyl-tRNA synthetase